MSIPCKFERSILSYDEHEIILRSHHPEIYDAALDDLKALRQRLREMRRLVGISRFVARAPASQKALETTNRVPATSEVAPKHHWLPWTQA
jgi:hypothetical protein